MHLKIHFLPKLNFILITYGKWLILFWETMNVYFDSNTGHMNMLCFKGLIKIPWMEFGREESSRIE